MVLYLPNFSLVFLIHVFLYAGVYCTNLWRLYQDGTLQKRLQDIFVTDKMRKLADGKDVEVNVTIDEDEYQKACIELIQGTQGALHRYV